MARYHNKQATQSKYRVYAPDQKPNESDAAYFKRLAKQADQRLVRLERYAEQEGFKHIKDWAYRGAMQDIKAFSGEDATRFNVMLPKTQEGEVNKIALKARINAVKRFLEDVTSTKQGIVKVYRGRADTINRKYGTNFTWEELANFYSKGYAEKFDQSIGGSDVILKAIGKIQRDDQAIIKGIRKANAEQKQIDKDAIVGEVADRLKEMGFQWSDLK